MDNRCTPYRQDSKEPDVKKRCASVGFFAFIFRPHRTGEEGLCFALV